MQSSLAARPPVLSPKGSPLVVVKRDERDLLEFVSTPLGFAHTFIKWNYGEGPEALRLQPYQVAFLQCPHRYRWITKARQTGYSWVIALEATVTAHLMQDHTSIFISYNQEDSKEKIHYVKQFCEDIPLAFQKKMVRERLTEVAFASNGRQAKVSRILSNPSRAPRGKHGAVYLDELAHYQNDREVFTGSTALVLRGKDRLTGCSTPLGQRGIFYEVARPRDPKKFANYWRQEVPWWRSEFDCVNVPEAVVKAAVMTTEERVHKYGSPDLQDQLEMLGVDDFQQEFECGFIDESASFFPYDLILPNTKYDLQLPDTYELLGRPQGRYVAGVDVGRRRDLGELAIFDETIDPAGQRYLKCVFVHTFDQVPFQEQEQYLRKLLRTLPIARLSIDENGIGMQLGETLAREFVCVNPEKFSLQFKELIAHDFKILLQRRALAMPRSRKIIGQLHSIKRKVTPAGNIIFEAERTKGGEHGDLAWALMLGAQANRLPGLERTPEVTVRFFE
jgi:phage FluMu gp28-like protein